MKHIFIVNPKAGKVDHTDIVREHLQKYDGKLDYYIYYTKGPKDATNYVKECLKHTNDYLRFYSCGGDGTLNEVINGAVGFDNCEVACYAIGSGNDFVKALGNMDDYKDLDKIINASAKEIDVMKYGGNYSLNICNFGLDAWAAVKMSKYKTWPLVSGKMAYNLGVIYSVLFKMKHNMKVEVDGEVLYDGNALLCSIANGICYGGGYYCAPKAKLDDGELDVCLVKEVSIFTLARLIGLYKAGKHLDSPKFKKYIYYKKGKNITVSSNKPIMFCNDGEVQTVEKLELSVVENALKFVII